MVSDNAQGLYKYAKQGSIPSAWFVGAFIVIELLTAAALVASPISAAIVATLVTVLLLLTKPEYAVFNFIFWSYPAPSLQVMIGEGSLTICDIAAVIAVVSVTIAVLAKTRPPRPDSKCGALLVLFGAWAALSLLWSHDRVNGFWSTVQLLVCLYSFFLILTTVRTKRTLMVIFSIVILMGIINACLALYYPYTDFYFYRFWRISDSTALKLSLWPMNRTAPEGRAMGFGTAHSTSALMALPITFAVILFITAENVKKRYWLIIAVLVMYAACTATLAKGPMIGLVFGTIYVAFHLTPLRQRLFTVMAVTVIMIAGLFCLARIKDIGKTIGEVGTDMFAVEAENQDRETSLGNRLTAFKIGAEKLWQTKGLGTGIGGFNQYLPFKHIDGTYAAVIFELGFIGFGLFLCILVRSYLHFINAIRTCRNEYFRRMLMIYMGGYVAILVSWIVTFSYVHVYLWLYLAIGFVMTRIAQATPADPDQKLPFCERGESIVAV